MSENNVSKVIIIGSGLVGTLCACFMAERGYDVNLYEKREDLRTMKQLRGRSINLSLSHRGRKALRAVGLEEEVISTAIDLKGRLLHSPTGELKSVLYDPAFNQCIYSVGRNYLNMKLIEATNRYPNIKLHFNHKLVRTNFNEGSITLLKSRLWHLDVSNISTSTIIPSVFEVVQNIEACKRIITVETKSTKTSEEIHQKADLIIGADGAYSKLRLAMQQMPMFQYSQEYIEHGYLELSIPSKLGDKMVPNHLHIWPRGELMMIALPNRDISWTVTLFMPFARFEMLDGEDKVLIFFREMFADAVQLIGEKDIVETFLRTKPSHLVSVKCSSYHAGSKFLIIGDAAHAMVPFFGQGMNAGFEDCSILNDLLTKNNNNIERSIREFSQLRVANGHAICDLAMYNYIEMRDLVNRTSYQLRKKIDNFLFKYIPTMWIPLYSTVSFSHMDYAQCRQNKKWQDDVIQSIFIVFGLLFMSIMYFVTKGFW